MKKIFVGATMIAMVGCAGHSAHSEVRDANDVIVNQVDYEKTGNGSTAYSSVTKLGAGTYPGMVPGLVGGYAPTGQTPMMIVHLPGQSEGMAAMEQHGAAPFVILQQPETVGLAPNGTPCADCLTTSDLDPIIGQFDNHEGRLRRLETTKKQGSGNAQPKKKGEPQP